DFLIIACNTAHAFARDIEAAVSVPIISMIDATADEAIVGKPSRVGVLAADGCRRANLYQNAFTARDVDALFLADDAQQEFMQLIYRIKAGDVGDATQRAMERLAISLTARGAQAARAACTRGPR